jgi:hypothetical protein
MHTGHMQVRELVRHVEAERTSKAVLIARTETHGHGLEAAHAELKDQREALTKLRAALAAAQEDRNHPALLELQAERTSRLAAEAAYHDALRSLIPLEASALEANDWRERVVSSATQAVTAAIQHEKELDKRAQELAGQQASGFGAKQRAAQYKEEAAALEVQVRLACYGKLCCVAPYGIWQGDVPNTHCPIESHVTLDL